MKWMLSIVVGALLATVAIGITQTVLLMRLTRETTAQQHRIEQLMQNQQAAMTSLLDAHLAAANAAAATPPAASTPVVAPRTPVAAAAGAAAPASKRKTHAHAHKPKAAPSH
jgi:type II secretory pathway pseudopilin PulG